MQDKQTNQQIYCLCSCFCSTNQNKDLLSVSCVTLISLTTSDGDVKIADIRKLQQVNTDAFFFLKMFSFIYFYVIYFFLNLLYKLQRQWIYSILYSIHVRGGNKLGLWTIEFLKAEDVGERNDLAAGVCVCVCASNTELKVQFVFSIRSDSQSG